MKNSADGLSGSKPRLKVLAVEDDPASREVLRLHLEERGYRLTCVGNGLECLDVLKSGNFDIILMDVRMPEMDGRETTRHIRKAGNTIPIIATTAHAFKDKLEEILKAGMDDFLVKPYDYDEMDRLIRKLVNPPAILKNRG
jgi:CheY-like chemotaxis protein